ncbi:deoxyribonuclease Tat-D [Aspergillus udagawae]|uniref:Deoxyribonuclease Tat-D n=2 Tax=Aspergillus udagawae TaxID=91492 RepID=A0A8H3NBH9_9EURO|nr:deoxyribonuclease Tat-D [Aspergillus udagawae]
MRVTHSVGNILKACGNSNCTSFLGCVGFRIRKKSLDLHSQLPLSCPENCTATGSSLLKPGRTSSYSLLNSKRNYCSAVLNKIPAKVKMCDSNKPLRYVDIGINLGDPVFRGEYHGRQVHENDLDDIIQRARDVGCTKFMVTGSDLVESRHAIQIAQRYPGFCYATVGVHPCQAKHFDEFSGGPDKMLEELKSLALEAKEAGHAVAFGEIGLDYDRLFLSAKEPQLKYFEAQLDLAVEIQLPLFLHSRAASEDFEKLLAPRLEKLPKKGLVHSFTGTMEEMERMVALGLDVGVNGCSLKTEENLEVVKAIPLDRIQIETDGPWCEIRPSHASSKYLEGAPALPKAVKKEKWQKGLMVKGRNEPVAIAHVAHVIAKLKDITVEEVCEAAWNNSVRMFGLGEEVS